MKLQSLMAIGFLIIAFCIAGIAESYASPPESVKVEKAQTAVNDASTVASTDCILHMEVIELSRVNVADRVTPTVETRFQPSVIRLPDAPSFTIEHVPLT